MSEIRNELNQILLRINGAALSNNFEEVEILIGDASNKLENGRAELDQETVQQLQSSIESMSGLARDMRNVHANSAYKAERPKTGRRGRPKIHMTANELKAFCGTNFKGTKMAEHFKCSTKSVYRRLKDEGLSNRYSNISKEDLDAQILDLKSSFPKAGLQMMQGYLVSRGISVQRERVRETLRRLDPEGTQDRWSTAVHRRRYSVATPNSLWHMDGHMKLIRWGFATHGCIDGFSRFITFLRCGINNNASTVLQLFVSACCSYGVPSRVRSDHGGENTKVALFMNLIRQRTSHITGRSVHNQRIERLWRDMHTQVTSKFYNEFYQMEDDPQINLDPDNMNHRSALQYVYLPAINRSLEEFRNGWNGHKIRCEAHMTPSQIWMSGMLDNMNSGYTPPSELFGVNPSIVDKLDSGLQRFGLTLDDVGLENSVVVPEVPAEIMDIINQELSNKEKFRQCAEFLVRQVEH